MTALSKDPARFAETAIDGEVVVMALDTGDFFFAHGDCGSDLASDRRNPRPGAIARGACC